MTEKVYRLYVKGECVETFGSGEAAKMDAMLSMGNWFSAGYTSDDCEIRLEDY